MATRKQKRQEQTKRQPEPKLAEAAEVVPVVATRVDPPHVLADSEPVAAEPAAEVANAPGEAIQAAQVLEQVRSQASQLAAHLRKQQTSVDHRESELNARLAAVESQVRSARLWLTERQQDMATQQAALAAQRKALAAREQQLAAEFGIDPNSTSTAGSFEARLAEMEAARQAIDDRCQQLDERSRELDQRQAQIDQTAKRSAGDAAFGRKAERLQTAVEKLEARQHHLDTAERLLADQEARLEAERLHLEDERSSLGEEIHAQRCKLADDRRQADDELEKERQKLRRRRDDLEARRTALKGLRADVTRTQRETLEMRLATEELWARLCGTMAPAALTQSLAQLRVKLADQQRLAHQELAAQRAELEPLAARLAEQHEDLTRQKRELQGWVKRREEEIEQQAARLVAREQSLDKQESDFKRQSQQWKQEKLGYEREIRRLLGQLRRVEAVAA